MGTSTNGQIWFGVLLGGRDYMDHEGRCGDGDDDVPGTVLCPWWAYDPETGVYRYQEGEEGCEDPLTDWWRQVNGAANPCPFEVVNYCSIDHPIYGLAVPGSVITAHRGYPVEMSRNAMMQLSADTQARRGYHAALKEHCDVPDPQPRWWLSSEWC